MKVTEAERVRMSELRQGGLSLEEISRITGFSIGTVSTVTKGVSIPVGLYGKRLIVGIFEGSIIDIETTGLYPDEDDIITFGFLVRDTITVMQRLEATASEFYQAVKSRVLELPSPLYAYNAKFERSFLAAKLKLDLDIIDIFEPWMQRAEREGRKYPALDDLARLPREYFEEQVLDGRQVPFLWRSYQNTGDKRKVSLVVRHNMEDLIQALYVLAQAEYRNTAR